MHELAGRVVERQPIYVAEIEEHDVGLVAGQDAADPIAEAERAGAAGRRRLEDLIGGDPAPIVGGPWTFDTIEASRVASYMF